MEKPPPPSESQPPSVDQQIHSLIENGDNDAVYVKLREVFFGYLKRVALSMTRNETEAEDAVEETLEKATINLPKFEWRSSLKTWLCTILTNQIRVNIRAKKSRPITVPLEEALGANDEQKEKVQIPDTRPNPEDEVINAEIEQGEKSLKEEKINILKGAIKTIENPDHRKIAELRILERLTFKEIAEKLSINESTAKAAYFRSFPKIERYAKKNYPLKRWQQEPPRRSSNFRGL